MLNLFRFHHNTISGWMNRSLSRIFYTTAIQNDASRPLFPVDEQYFHTSEGRFLFLLKHCTFNNSLLLLCTHNCCETKETQLQKMGKRSRIHIRFWTTSSIMLASVLGSLFASGLGSYGIGIIRSTLIQNAMF